MVASNLTMEYQDHLADRILGRLCEAAELVTSNLCLNRNRLRELIDDLSLELDAGDVALDAMAAPDHRMFTGSQIRLAYGSAHSR